MLETLPKVLPRSSGAASSSSSAGASSTLLRSPQDGLAAIFHAALTRLDFRLVGLAEDDRLSDYASEQASSEGSSSSSASTNTLPSAWNKNGPESYTLRYRHDQSSLTFLLKLLRMSTRVLVHASAVEDKKTATWELPLADYTSQSFYPYPKEGEGNAEPLVNGFISTSRLTDLLLAFKGKVIQKLVPGLRKDGYEESVEEDTTGQGPSSSASSTRPRPRYDPDDPFPAHPPQGGVGQGIPYPGRNPLAIGDRDLNPLGGALPPGAGHGPPPLFGGGGGGGGGMYVGPDDPIFRDRFGPRGGGGGPGGPQGPWGGDGFLPPGAVPPGARFDPVGPFGAGPRGAFGPDGRILPPGGRAPRGDPDWDDVRPPGGNSDYDNMFM